MYRAIFLCATFGLTTAAFAEQGDQWVAVKGAYSQFDSRAGAQDNGGYGLGYGVWFNDHLGLDVTALCTGLRSRLPTAIFVSMIGFFSYAMPHGSEKFFSYLGTMTYRGHPVPVPSIAFTAFWLFLTYFLSTILEAGSAARRWESDAFTSALSPTTLFWRVHLITYPLLLLLFWAIRLRA
jgi:hypothetical protein